MARITVEDCTLVPNRFELVLLAAKRSRELTAGAPLTVARDNDKNAVVSLREIAEGSINLEILREKLIRGMQRHAFVVEPESELAETENELNLDLNDDDEDDDENIHAELMVEKDLINSADLTVEIDLEARELSFLNIDK